MMQTSKGLIILASMLACGSAGCLQQPSTLQKLQQQQIAPQPQTITINMTGYVAPTGRRLGNFFVSNFSAKASQGNLSQMTSRDLPDTLKSSLAGTYGFTTSGPYSTGYAFSDLVFYLSGITQSQQGMLYCADNQKLSGSNDAIVYTDAYGVQQLLGLRDCEKLYLGLNPAKFDFDGDGVPDYLELRCGMNPKNPHDAVISVAADGISNIEKCKRNIPNDESATSQPNLLYAYSYMQYAQPDGSLQIKVSNIPVTNAGQDNFIAIYLTETDVSTTNNTSTPADATGFPYLYTAFAVLKSGAAGKTFNFPFWAKRPNKAGADPTTYTSQGLVFQ